MEEAIQCYNVCSFLVLSALHLYLVINSLSFQATRVVLKLCFFLYEAMPFVTAQPPTSIDQSWEYIHGMVFDPSNFIHADGSSMCVVGEFDFLG